MTPEIQARTSNSKLSEALELLNEAAKEKKDELKGLMANKYTHIRDAMTTGVDHGQKAFHQAKDLAKKAISEGEKKVKEVAGDVDKRVHKDPWPYIAGTAAVSLLLGYFMGSQRK